MPFLENLEPLLQQALERARTSLENHGRITPFFVLHFPDGHIKNLILPPDHADVMNSSAAKEVIFGCVRTLVKAAGADATIFASGVWDGRLIAAGQQAPREELRRLLTEKAYETALALGFVERREAIGVVAQDREHMLLIIQAFHREDGRVVYEGEPEREASRQADFRGLTKMFGEVPPMRPEAERLGNSFLADKLIPE